MRLAVFFGAINGFLAVAFGAFGAHAVKGQISPENYAIYETAAHYHLTHALALLLVGLLARVSGRSRVLAASGWLFLVGIVVFSGSLYALALTGQKLWGAVTPIGGLCFLAGWVCLAMSGWSRSLRGAQAEGG